MIDIVETVYRGASKGRGLVVAPKGKSDRVGPTTVETYCHDFAALLGEQTTRHDTSIRAALWMVSVVVDQHRLELCICIRRACTVMSKKFRYLRGSTRRLCDLQINVARIASRRI